MLEAYNNKQVENSDFKGDTALHAKSSPAPLIKFHFPLHQKTIEAATLAEAEAKLKDLLKPTKQ